MKKIFKILSITILICIVSIGTLLFTFKNRINLCVNIAKNYFKIEEDFESIEDLTCYTPLDNMDYKDVVYKGQNGVDLTLDIFGPKKKLENGSPVIVFVHGGSWLYGNKAIPKELSPVLNAFRESGYTVISTSYELLKDGITLDKPISDVKDTIRWINKNKDYYGFNTEEVGIIGFSAGAHLSLLSAYSDNNEFIGDESLSSYASKIKYVVDIFGPTDLSTLDIKAVDNVIAEKLYSLSNLNDIQYKYSPINYVKEGVPETLIIHSKNDKLVPYENSTILYEKLLNVSTKTKLVSLDKSDHDLSSIDTEDITPLAIELLQFIIKNSPI